MTAAFPGPATSRLMTGVSHPHPVNGGRWYRPARRPPSAMSKPGLERSGTTAHVAVRQEPPPATARPARRIAISAALTVTVADSCPRSSIRPATGDSASIRTVAPNRLTPRTLRLMAAGRSTRFPLKGPGPGSARTVSDPRNGTRSESRRTVRKPRTSYSMSVMEVLLVPVTKRPWLAGR
jgi:hypothetical protein